MGNKNPAVPLVFPDIGTQGIPTQGQPNAPVSMNPYLLGERPVKRFAAGESRVSHFWPSSSDYCLWAGPCPGYLS